MSRYRTFNERSPRCLQWLECGKHTIHKSGLCSDHRQTQCAFRGCVLTYAPQKNQTYCWKHRVVMRDRDNAIAEVV